MTQCHIAEELDLQSQCYENLNLLCTVAGVGKKSDKWDGGNAPQVHSDGEVDETIPTASTSAPPFISSKPCSGSFPGSDHKPQHIVWRKCPDFAFDMSDGGSFATSDLTDVSRDSRLSSISSVEMCVLAPVVRRDSKLSHHEAASTSLFAEQWSRTPLKTSISHDERHSACNPDPEVPVRMARRQRAPQEVVCHSVGEELTDSSSVDPLRTIQETNTSSDGYSAGQNRTVCQILLLFMHFCTYLFCHHNHCHCHLLSIITFLRDDFSSIFSVMYCCVFSCFFLILAEV